MAKSFWELLGFKVIIKHQGVTFSSPKKVVTLLLHFLFQFFHPFCHDIHLKHINAMYVISICVVCRVWREKEKSTQNKNCLNVK